MISGECNTWWCMLFSWVCSSSSSYFAILVKVRQKKEVRRSWDDFPALATCRSGASAMNFFHQVNSLVANESLIMPDMDNKVPLCKHFECVNVATFFLGGGGHLCYRVPWYDATLKLQRDIYTFIQVTFTLLSYTSKLGKIHSDYRIAQNWLNNKVTIPWCSQNVSAAVYLGLNTLEFSAIRW